MSGRKEAAKDEVPNKGGRKLTDFVLAFFQFCYMKTNFFLIPIIASDCHAYAKTRIICN